MEWRKKWLCPSDSKPRTIEDVIERIKQKEDSSVYIGCDSHAAKGYQNKYLFAIAICILSKSGNIYFYSRGIHIKTFESLQDRLTEEVSCSVEVASILMKHFPSKKITLHADSNVDAKHKSARYTDVFRNWAQGIGCDFASKPDAWASSSIADKHSK